MTTNETPSGASSTRPPWLDRVLGEWTGEVLSWLAKRAKRRGDAHEFAHLYGAVVFGNSNHDGRWPCGLGYVQGYLAARGDADLQTFTVTLTPPPNPDSCTPDAAA